MQFKNSIVIVPEMASMCGMYKLYVCIIWNTHVEHVGRVLKYSTLLPVGTQRTCDIYMYVHVAPLMMRIYI